MIIIFNKFNQGQISWYQVSMNSQDHIPLSFWVPFDHQFLKMICSSIKVQFCFCQLTSFWHQWRIHPTSKYFEQVCNHFLRCSLRTNFHCSLSVKNLSSLTKKSCPSCSCIVSKLLDFLILKLYHIPLLPNCQQIRYLSPSHNHKIIEWFMVL